MMVLNEIWRFIKILNFVDVVFLSAIVVLVILLVTLVYFVKINNDILGEEDFFSQDNLKNDIASTVDSINFEKNIEDEEYDDEKGDLIDLETLTKKLKNQSDDDRISYTEYEKDQEEKAIISYDELLKSKNKYAVNYEKEELLDDIIVKKVDLNDLTNKSDHEEEKEAVRVISYDHEEAFLTALKELNSLLN